MRKAIAWLAALAALAILAFTTPTRAVPVRVGHLGATLFAGTDPRHPQPTERGNVHRTGRLRGVLPHAETRVLWDVALEAAHPRGPIVDREGRVFVGTAHGLVALSATGELLLDLRVGPIDTAPAILPSGELLVVTHDRVLAIYSPTGELAAQRAIGAAVRAAPLVLDDGSFVLAALDRTVTHYGSDLGERFVVTLDEGGVTTPSLTTDGFVAVCGGSTLSVIDLVGQTTRATIPLGARAVGPAIAGPLGTLYQLLVDGTVVMVEDHARIGWRRSLEARAYEGTAMAMAPDGSLRIAMPTRGVLALDPAGEVLWTFSADAPFFGGVNVDEEGNALAVDRRGRLTILDPRGALRFRVDLGVAVASAAIAERQLIVSSDRPSVMAFEIP